LEGRKKRKEKASVCAKHKGRTRALTAQGRGQVDLFFLTGKTVKVPKGKKAYSSSRGRITSEDVVAL